jgi:hypothetical protein
MSCDHVVLCPVPGAHDAALSVDAAACEVGAQVAALTTHSEVFAVVADGVLFDTGGRSIRLACSRLVVNDSAY